MENINTIRYADDTLQSSLQIQKTTFSCL